MILINDEAVFVHMPRTGGSFIRQMFEESDLKIERLNITHGSVKKIDTDKYYTFGFVRNPWAWSVSIYLQFGGNPNGSEYAFRQYLRQNCPVNTLQNRYYDQYFRDDKLVVDVFKTEDFEPSLHQIFDKFNWKKPDLLLGMDHVNTKLRDRTTTYHEFYNEWSNNMVYQYNEDIIKAYDYSF